MTVTRSLFLFAFLTSAVSAFSAPPGYYRFPAIHGDTIVFTSQGDLFKVGVAGGTATNLTTHPGSETNAAISPDGKRVAFTASYEGPAEVYLMPIEGGLPTRLTYDGTRAVVVGWTPDGKVIYRTSYYSTFPDQRLYTIDPASRARIPVPLSQASEGVYDDSGKTLYFTRLPFQGSHTKRYNGGTAQNLWKLTTAATEAVPLTPDYTGTSKNPMWWRGRVYFVSDRDGTMNLWSMDSEGRDLKQHTHHDGWDVQEASVDTGRIVYQLGADLWIFDIPTARDRKLDITIGSDLDQMRERWIAKPMQYLTRARVSPDGDRIVLTARGQVFAAPTSQGRFVEASRKPGVRYRQAQFGHDGKSIIALSDETGETEWWRLPANGVGRPEPVSKGAAVLALDGEVSPNGKWIAYYDKNQELWLLDVAERKAAQIAANDWDNYRDLRWSPDSRWLAYVEPTETFVRIHVYSVSDRKVYPLTSDRVDSYSPAWSPDGKWLYFLSARSFNSLVPSPWGPRQPEPVFDKQTQVLMISLKKGQTSPWQPNNELTSADVVENKEPKEPKKVDIAIDLDHVRERLFTVPIPPGNYTSLEVGEKRLFLLSADAAAEPKPRLIAVDISRKDVTVKTLVDDVKWYELTADRKKLALRKGDELFVLDSSTSAPAALEKSKVDLTAWTFPINPREEWRQMFVEAWRLERDYFYDPKLHGAEWNALLKKYLPLADRITDREELSDALGQMVSELSALHMVVIGGDVRQGTDQVLPASLGAVLERDEKRRGYRVEKIYRGDPDFPEQLSPLAKAGVDIEEGDLIEKINGVDLLTVADPSELLRSQSARQVLLHVRPSNGKERDVIVTPLTMAAARDLRYSDWELSRRKMVDELGKGELGYVHLRAMGKEDIEQWEREFYPIFNRQGLIVDVRHNGGGNIDSWILEKLMRRAWMYWQGRVGKPTWNMQWAFRGHIVVLCDEKTASDGEAFAEGFRRLGLGKVIGTRTWGGEIWLSMTNRLVDNGIAAAAETGVYGPEGIWLIEGHGVDPDIVVDNLPVATYRGEDKQLETAIKYLQQEIRDHPLPLPPPPKYPIKARNSP